MATTMQDAETASYVKVLWSSAKRDRIFAAVPQVLLDRVIRAAKKAQKRSLNPYLVRLPEE